jgi:hypothetical protein
LYDFRVQAQTIFDYQIVEMDKTYCIKEQYNLLRILEKSKKNSQYRHNLQLHLKHHLIDLQHHLIELH